ncbi:MAG: OmpA family protein [Myxococcota bacterium]
MFEPAIGVDRFLTVEGPGVPRHMRFDVGVFGDYQHKPLSIFLEEDGSVGEEQLALVERQVGVRAVVALGLLDRFQVGLDVPATVDQQGDYFDLPAGKNASSSGIGDPRLHLKARVLGSGEGFSFAVASVLSYPASGGEAFRGSDNVTFRPRLLAGWRRGRFDAAANAGWLTREETRVLSSSVDDQLLYGVAAGWAVRPTLRAIGEVYGRSGLNRNLTESPAEAGAAIEWELVPDVRVEIGGGAGVIQGLGAPPFRVLAQVHWSPDPSDADLDGVRDRFDACPGGREDRDGFHDEDGCEDPDDDDDLLPDVQDRCRTVAEDKDGFEDEDGCPDPDNDGDRVRDLVDECPMKPGPPESRGCPPGEADKDEDGVVDAVDKCVDEAEDQDEFEDADGCPEPDNDGDGVPDGFDECPNKAEDADGKKDEDGCPDLDDDADGVIDRSDKCPAEQETINGNKDDDGCADPGEPKAILQGADILLVESIRFKGRTAKWVDEAETIVAQVAQIIRANADLKQVRIEAHTDDDGGESENLVLTQKRADALRQRMIDLGVEPARLTAVGYGQARPKGDNATKQGRAANRRVEIHAAGE